MKKLLSNFILFFVTVLLFIGGVFFHARTLYQIHSDPLPHDIPLIVCLAGGKGRIEASLKLWETYQKKNIDQKVSLLILGMGKKASFHTLSRYLPKDVPIDQLKDTLVLDTKSQNTVQNALILRAFLKKHDSTLPLPSILIITSSYHLKRAQWIFSKLLSEYKNHLVFYALPFKKGFFQWSALTLTFREYIKWIYYRYFWNPSSLAKQTQS